MVDLQTLGTFVVIMAGLFLVPGPAVLLVLSRTVQGGRRAGVMTSIGVALGDVLHTLAAAAGLSALLMTSALAFSAVKYVGAAYLFYLGWRAWHEPAGDARLSELAGLTPARACLQAMVTELLNPKTTLFFIAFLPQFVRPERGHAFMQCLELGLVFAVGGALYTVLLVITLRPLRHLLSRLPALRRLQGTLLIGLGLKVAAQSR